MDFAETFVILGFKSTQPPCLMLLSSIGSDLAVQESLKLDLGIHISGLDSGCSTILCADRSGLLGCLSVFFA